MAIISEKQLLDLIEELGPDPRKHQAFIASITNVLAGITAHGIVEMEGDETAIARRELMSLPFQEGIPDDPNQTEWVNKLSEWTAKEIFPAYEKAVVRHLSAFQGKHIPDPNSGQGFGKS